MSALEGGHRQADDLPVGGRPAGPFEAARSSRPALPGAAQEAAIRVQADGESTGSSGVP